MSYLWGKAITLNADSSIASAVADFPGYVKLTKTNFPLIFLPQFDATKVKFTSDSLGTAQLDHELIVDDSSTKEYFVKTSTWTFYLWLGDDDESDTSNPTGVWGSSAKYIGHFITDANDSSANENHGTVTGATLTEDDDYLGGYCYSFDGDGDYIILPDIDLLEGTFLVRFKHETGGGTSINSLIRHDDAVPSADYAIFVYVATSTVYVNAIGDTGTKNAATSNTVTGNIDFVSAVTFSGDYIKVNLNNYGWKSTDIGNIATPTATTKVGGNSAGSWYKGKIDFVWIFSDAKSDDFISAVYNNLEDYDKFVSIEGEEGFITFDGDAPAIIILDADGNTLDDTLDENTYATFGTIPKGGNAPITLYVKNTGATPIYSAKCEGIASSNQLGEAANTYEAIDLPQELGNIDPRETIELQVVWTVPATASTGMKIFGLKVEDSTYLAISENHDYFVKITITNNDTDLLTDFPIEIDLDVDSIDWSKTTSDGRDLRFYDENFNSLSYYIETWIPATTTGKVWVRVPKIIGKETIYLYLGYGKFDLYSASDLYAKYEFHENFNGAFDEDWTLTGSMNYSFVVNMLELASGGSSSTGLIHYFDFPINSGIVIEFAGTRPLNSTSHVNLISIYGLPAAGGTRFQILKEKANHLYICNYDCGNVSGAFDAKIIYRKDKAIPYYPATTERTTSYNPVETQDNYIMISSYSNVIKLKIDYIYIYKYCKTAPTIVFTDVADIAAEFTNPDVDSGIICVIGNVVRQLQFHNYDFKKIIYEVGYNNALWRPPGSSGIYVWGKLEMRPLYGEDVSFVDNLYANDAYFYTFTDYQYDIHDKLDVEGVLYDIQAIQVHDAGRETIYKTLILKRQPEYYACCVGIVS